MRTQQSRFGGGRIQAFYCHPVCRDGPPDFILADAQSTAGPGLATFWGAYEILLYILLERNGQLVPNSEDLYRA